MARKKAKKLNPAGDRSSAAITRGYLDAKQGVPLEDNFYRRIRSSVFMCGWWDKGWQQYHEEEKE